MTNCDPIAVGQAMATLLLSCGNSISAGEVVCAFDVACFNTLSADNIDIMLINVSFHQDSLTASLVKAPLCPYLR